MPEEDLTREESQHKEDKTHLEEHLPSYLKGTRNFKTRAASAPRGRSVPDVHKSKAAANREGKVQTEHASTCSTTEHCCLLSHNLSHPGQQRHTRLQARPC